MRTGIKTLYNKIRLYVTYPDRLLKAFNSHKFPSYGISQWKIRLKIYSLRNYLNSIKLVPNLNEIRNTPHPLALKAWNSLLPYNPNNIGNWSTFKQSDLDGTQKAEWLLIQAMIDLYGGSQSEWEGYVTNGASDSNLYAMWLGRNSLINYFPIEKICVLQNDLTHYSVFKSSNILNLKIYSTQINSQTWTYDISSLKKTIELLIRKDYRGFIIPLTNGYAQTGTNDNYKKITQMMAQLKKIYDIQYFIFIDAALNGLVLPFSTKNFYPLKDKNISSINVDFHKFGMVPFPCGIVLYRKNLRKSIQLHVQYLQDYDSTISGSRSGVSPVSALMVLLALGKTGFSNAVQLSIQSKNEFIKQVEKKFKKVEIINDEQSITIGLASKNPLPKEFLNSTGLFSRKMTYHFEDKDRKLFIYKATFIKYKN